MRLESDFFDLCAVIRDRYASQVRSAKNTFEKRLKEIETDYKGERLRNEKVTNKQRFDSSTEAAADHARKAIEDAFIQAAAREEAAVSCVTVGADVLRALDGLAGVPISKEEMDILAASLCDKGYWICGKLRELAKANGILELAIPPTYTEKMSALTEAKERLLAYVEKSDVDGLNMEVTDKALRLLESEYSGGFIKYNMSAEKQAALLMDKAKNCGDPMSAAVFVKNALSTASEEVRGEIVKIVSADNSFWGSIREIGGLQRYLDGIRKEAKTEEKSVLPLVADARLAGAVAKLTESERSAALFGSAVTPDNVGADRKIDRQGLDFLETEEGAEMVKDLERVHARMEAEEADKAEEAAVRAEIEGA